MNKIALSDGFMFVGHCQYSPKSWQTRNYIRQANGKIMLSVPVEKSLGQSINDTKIIEGRWRYKHLESIWQAYSKRPFFDLYYPDLAQIISSEFLGTLAELNIAITISLLDWLNIDVPIFYSEEMGVTGNKTDMLASMCRMAGYQGYLSNEGARDYVDEGKMKSNGFEHHWQKFTHPVYEQGHREFIPNLSVIDLLFNCGPESGKIVEGCGYVE